MDIGASVGEEAVGSSSSFYAPEAEADADADSFSSQSAADGTSALLELPSDCLVRVLSFLSVLDACRVARVCRRLRTAADSDEVWLTRLPANPPINPPSISKKDLYFRLRAGMLHKDLSQPYWLDPGTGEGCFVKSARDFTIEWGDDPRYWIWEPQPDSWFPESACLLDVCWFEVRGEFESVFMPGNYIVLFRIRLTNALSGWVGSPVKLSISTSNGHHEDCRHFFSGKRNPSSSIIAPLRPLDSCSWMELDAGRFSVEREMHVKLKFSMMEIDGGRWKKGVILDCVKIQSSRATSNISDLFP